MLYRPGEDTIQVQACVYDMDGRVNHIERYHRKPRPRAPSARLPASSGCMLSTDNSCDVLVHSTTLTMSTTCFNIACAKQIPRGEIKMCSRCK